MIVDYYLSLLVQITAIITYVIGITVLFICGKSGNLPQKLFLAGFIYSAAIQVYWLVEMVRGYNFQMFLPIKFIFPVMLGLPLYKSIFSAFINSDRLTIKKFFIEYFLFVHCFENIGS